MVAAQDKYRDRLFTFIFGSEEHRDWTLSLFNAVNGSNCVDPSAVTINTIKEILYLGMHNDVSFLLGEEMSLYEQQSTINPNMPLRMMQYAAQLFEGYVSKLGANKYGSAIVKLPAPRLVVFYNGKEDMPDETILRLSDAFPAGASHDIEVTVRMINVNEGHSKELLSACVPLREYAWLVARIRDNLGTMSLRQAIDEAVMAMPKDFVIAPFLLAHKAEVVDMLLTEYDEQEVRELFRKEGEAIGEARGITIGEARGVVRACQALGATFEEAVARVSELLGMAREQAESEVAQYWA